MTRLLLAACLLCLAACQDGGRLHSITAPEPAQYSLWVHSDGPWYCYGWTARVEWRTGDGMVEATQSLVMSPTPSALYYFTAPYPPAERNHIVVVLGNGYELPAQDPCWNREGNGSIYHGEVLLRSADIPAALLRGAN